MDALKDTNPQFATAYDRHYWELKQGKLHALGPGGSDIAGWPDMLNMVLNSLSHIRSSGFADSTLSLEAMGLNEETAQQLIQ